MSSSLFYDCYTSYEMPAKAEYVGGDKKFSEIVKNDTLYSINDWCEIKELKVTKTFHQAHGHCYISVAGKMKAINFGPTNCANSRENANKSIVYSDSDIIGTNKASVVAIKRKQIENEMDIVRRQLANLEHKLNALNSIKI